MKKLIYYKHQFVVVDKTVELFFTGCSQHCPGCQNEFLQVVSNENSHMKTPEEIVKELIDYVPIAKSVHLLGGEPLEQDLESLCELTRLLKHIGFKNIILFTGKNDISMYDKKYFRYIDYIKIGSYDENDLNVEKKKDPVTGMILASCNQKVVLNNFKE